MTNEKDKELIEAVATPWICVEAKPCEETVAVHWEELLTALTAGFATVRGEEREAAFKDATRLVNAMSRIEARHCSIEFINGAQWAQDQVANLLASQVEATENRKGEG